jgi:hypothetical protein
MQHARTPAMAVHGIPRNTQRVTKPPVRGLVLAGASQVAQGVSTYQDTKLQELALIKAHAPIDGASGDEKPSLWSFMKSTLRVVAVIGVAAIMVRLRERYVCFLFVAAGNLWHVQEHSTMACDEGLTIQQAGEIPVIPWTPDCLYSCCTSSIC